MLLSGVSLDTPDDRVPLAYVPNVKVRVRVFVPGSQVTVELVKVTVFETYLPDPVSIVPKLPVPLYELEAMVTVSSLPPVPLWSEKVASEMLCAVPSLSHDEQIVEASRGSTKVTVAASPESMVPVVPPLATTMFVGEGSVSVEQRGRADGAAVGGADRATGRQGAVGAQGRGTGLDGHVPDGRRRPSSR
jgi:hypothetical protein